MQFLGWLEKFHPEMAAAVVQRVGEAPKADGLSQLGEAWDMFYPSMYYGSGGYRDRYHSQGEHLSGLGQNGDYLIASETTTSGNGWDFSWATEVIAVAKEIVPAYLAYDAQKDLMDLNMERAKQGKEPIDPGLVAPQIRVVHDLPPETRSLIDQFKMGGINILLWGGIAIAGFFLIRQLR